MVELRRREAYPLSQSQLNIWALEQAYLGTPINNICETVRIRGRFDVAVLQQTLDLLIQTDGTLRTRIFYQDDTLLQYETEYVPERFPVFDFSKSDIDGLRHWETSIATEAMPVVDAPLSAFYIFKLGEHEGGVVLKTHHLISDGWSQVLTINKMADIYLRLLGGEEVEIEHAPSYRNHVQSETEYRASRHYKSDSQYWQKVLADPVHPAALRETGAADISPIGKRLVRTFSRRLNHAIYNYCTENRVAPFAVFYMALALYIKRTDGADRFSIGVPIFNRISPSDRKTTGMFVSTLPFINTIDESWSFSQFTEELMINWYDLLRHQRLPYEEIMDIASRAGHGSRDLAHIAFSFHNSHVFNSPEASVSVAGQWNYSGYQAEQLCIHLHSLLESNRFEVNYDYLTQIFSEKDMSDLHKYLTNIISNALADTNKPLSEISMTDDKEAERVIYNFNETGSYLPDISVYDKLLEIKNTYAGRAAIIYQGQRTSYVSLLQRADAYARIIQQTLEKDNNHDDSAADNREVVALLLPRSLDLLAAMCAAAQSGKAWLILDPKLPQGRIDEIIADSGCRIVFGSKELLDSYNLKTNSNLSVVETDNLNLELAEELLPSAVKADDIAYMIYTSGSTGKPKGVMISNRNLLNFALGMKEYYVQDAVLSLTNTSFDAFMIESMSALLNGRTIILPEEGTEENPSAMAHYIQEYAVGLITMTPARLSACLHNDAFRQAASRLQSIICGGEVFPPTLLHQLSLVTAARIYNQYGPSETTVGVTIKQLNDTDMITAGKPMRNCRIYVLDAQKKPLPCGVCGEIYIGGFSVGAGYHNQPEQTAAAFCKSPFEPVEMIYCTGDLGYWNECGDLVFCGREDNQVKLRGLRIELDEIAARIALHQEVTHAVARIIEHNGQQLIAAYYVSGNKLAERELLEIATAYLPYYMIPAVFIHLEHLPLTPNGKLDADKLPGPEYIDSGDNASGSAVEAKIIAIFQKVLGDTDIDASSDYFMCGGNSLNAMEALALIEEEFAVRLKVADIYACRRASRLARLLGDETPANNARPASLPLEAAPALELYPLSPIQQSLYFQTMLDPNSISYNMPGAIILPDAVSLPQLEKAFAALFAAEDIFRSSFVFENGQFAAKIAAAVDFKIEQLEAADIDAAAQQFIRPFDLTQAPLLHAAVYVNADQKNILFIDIHHLIGDGLSMPLLMDKLNHAYAGDELESAAFSYKDYAYALSQKDQDIDKTEDNKFWAKALADLPQPLDLPTDFPRPAQFDFCGDKYNFAIPPELSAKINAYCSENGLTAAMFFASAYALLLAKFSHNQDIIVGMPVSGRDTRELAGIIGPFISTQPLRLQPREESILQDYLDSAREMFSAVVDHQQLSLEEMLTLSHAPRKAGSNALYQTMFSLRPLAEGSFSLAGERLITLPLNNHTAKMELSLEAYQDANNSYAFTFEYATSLFEARTMAFYARIYQSILEQFLLHQQSYLKDIDCLAEADRYQLIEKPQHMCTPFVDIPLDMQMSRIAAHYPDRIALICQGTKITYAELEQRAGHIAGQLQAAGVKPGDRVALLCKRSIDMIAGLLAINKTGGAYIPLSTSFPKARIAYMLENSAAALVLCDQAGFEVLSEDLPCPKLMISDRSVAFMAPAHRSSSDLIHILYTSGSTGKPKGVPICHRALANLLGALRPILQKCQANILCSTNIIFDTFIFESLLPLAIGKTVILADEEEMLLPWKMAELIEQQNITLMQLTPSRLQMCLGNNLFRQTLGHIEQLVLAGEPLNRELIAKVKACGDIAVINLYGPSEAAVYVCGGEMPTDQRPHIGQPLQNCRVYLLDEQRRPVLPTARGELYLSGICLAEGYCDNEELTKQAFLPDPFCPGERMYKTGDLGRLMLDGNIDFLGRADNQIKLNGQRVELDDINGAILNFAGARDAITVVVHNEDSAMSLHSFIVPQDNMPLDLEILRKHLQKLLPEYMLPSEMIVVAEFPRTASGKTDMLALQQQHLNGQQQAAELSPSLPDEKEQLQPDAVSAVDSHSQTDNSAEDSLEVAVEIVEIVNTVADEAIAQEQAPLPGMALEALDEAALLKLWKAVLEKEDFDENKSFFEQGGTSLAALNLLSLCFNAGLSMTLADFYQNPTFAAQKRLLPLNITQPSAQHIVSGKTISAGDIAHSEDNAANIADKEGNKEATAESNEEDNSTVLSAPDKELSTPQVAVEQTNAATVKPEDIKTRIDREKAVLLTGAAGFFGAHLLRELCQADYQVVCLIRGNKQRFIDAIDYYFGMGWLKEHLAQIVLLCGDITQPDLGLNINDIAAVKAIYHTAADVRHFAADNNSFLVNQQGTAHVLKCAMALSVPLHHMSTLSVCGEYRFVAPSEHTEFTEDDYDIGQNWQDNVYIRNKFQAEQLVYTAIRQGLPAKIYRLGRLGMRQSDGLFQINPDGNSYWEMARGLAQLEMLPQFFCELPLEITPVDEAARAVMLLKDSERICYHIANDKLTTVAKLAERIKGYPLPAVEDEDFFNHLSTKLHENRNLAAFTELYIRLKQRVPTIEPKCEITSALLKAKNFVWQSPLTIDYSFLDRVGGGGNNI